MGKKKKKYRLAIETEACKGCRLCIDICPNQVLEFSTELNAGGVPYPLVKKPGDCIGCRSCTLVCPDVCIEIYETD